MKGSIILSGFAGSEKSSVADNLGKELGIKVVHASALLKEMKDSGVKALEKKEVKKIEDWWESKEAKEFMKKRQQDSSLDIALDKKLIQIAEKGNAILDSWTMPYLYKGKAFKIWLNASAETRAERVSKRDGLDFKGVLAKIRARDAETKALYQRLYNFSMGEQLELFTMVLSTDTMPQEEVLEKVLRVLGKE